MAVDPTANATWIASHQLPLVVGTDEIVNGIAQTIVSITDETAPAYQRLNLTTDLNIPGGLQAIYAFPFGTGQNVFLKNGIGLWVEFACREVSPPYGYGTNPGGYGGDGYGGSLDALALKPTTQKV